MCVSPLLIVMVAKRPPQGGEQFAVQNGCESVSLCEISSVI